MWCLFVVQRATELSIVGAGEGLRWRSHWWGVCLFRAGDFGGEDGLKRISNLVILPGSLRFLTSLGREEIFHVPRSSGWVVSWRLYIKPTKVDTKTRCFMLKLSLV